MHYNLFVSYSRKDNKNGRITELVNFIKQDYLEFYNEDLTYFFDTKEIKVSEDWRHRILQSLRNSHLLLIILTPNYLVSEHCKWELNEYLKYEYSNGITGDGIALIYFSEIPGFGSDEFKSEVPEWFKKLCYRQSIDCRHWYNEGLDSLKRDNIKNRFEEIRSFLRKKISRMQVISKAEGNLPAPNPQFVGRGLKLRELHEILYMGRFGVLTAVHGLGGLGKTSIAFQYAHAHRHIYPGGTWYISCSGRKKISTVLKSLNADLNVQFSEEEKKDDIKGAKKILNELKLRSDKNSNTEILPAALLILDNVDQAELIEPPETDLISGKEWLKVLVTTIMGPKELHTDGTSMSLLPIDELSYDDAVSLIESYQPGGKFCGIYDEEKEMAKEIVEMLGGFTLAIEVAALYLNQMEGRVSCKDFVELLKNEGIEKIGSITKKPLSHTKLISATLKPTLKLLPENEILILKYSSLLSPDSIPLSWLKSLTEKVYPEFKVKNILGKDNPWISSINHLISLRLLKVVQMDNNGRSPSIVSIHKLIQEEIVTHIKDREKKLREVIIHIKKRSFFLYENWLKKEVRWEINPIQLLAFFWMNNKIIESHEIAVKIAEPLKQLGKLTEAKELLEKAITIQENTFESSDYTLAVSYSDLANVESQLGNFNNSKKLLEESVKILESIYTWLAACYSNLAAVEKELGNTGIAKKLMKKCLEIAENNLTIDQRSLALFYSHLGVIEMDLKNLEKAEEYLKKSIKIQKKIYKANSPFLAVRYMNLGLVKKNLLEIDESKRLLMLAKKIFEIDYNPNKANLAKCYSNLGLVENDMKNYNKAKKYFQKAIEIQEKILSPEHPNLAISYASLALSEEGLKNLPEAKNQIERAIKIQEKIFKEKHPNLIKSYVVLERLKKKLNKTE